MRTFDVLAQALSGAIVEARQHHVLSPGQLVQLARGECGDVKAVQLAGDFRTLYLQCDNCTVALRVDEVGGRLLRALMHTSVNVPSDEQRPGMVSERFSLGADGRPVRVVTDPK